MGVRLGLVTLGIGLLLQTGDIHACMYNLHFIRQLQQPNLWKFAIVVAVFCYILYSSLLILIQVFNDQFSQDSTYLWNVIFIIEHAPLSTLRRYQVPLCKAQGTCHSLNMIWQHVVTVQRE